MIFCISPNPALDHTLVVPTFKQGIVLRAESSLSAAGGKGLNVARAAQILGAKTRSFCFLGGRMGKTIAELARHKALDGNWTWIDGETRTCVIIADGGTGEATVINEQGPRVTAADWSSFSQSVLADISEASDVCFSGSLPPKLSIRNVYRAGHGGARYRETGCGLIRATHHCTRPCLFAV